MVGGHETIFHLVLVHQLTNIVVASIVIMFIAYLLIIHQGAITITCIVNNHNHYLILCIFNCKRRQ
jgi:hypothetical protein